MRPLTDYIVQNVYDDNRTQFQPSYLPKRIRHCPQCGDRDQVQIIIYGMPAGPPAPEEKDRVAFASCVMPFYDDPEQEPPKWHCPTCEVSYTGRGEIVPEQDGW